MIDASAIMAQATERDIEWWGDRSERHARNQGRFEAEIAMSDGLMACLAHVPQWAIQVRQAMPDWGFEIHCIRWLDGLDMILHSIRDQRHYPTPFGRYGDWPGHLLNAVEARAAAVQAWLDASIDPSDGLAAQAASWLGEADPLKQQAARCFVDIGRTPTIGRDLLEKRVDAWQARRDENPILQLLFYGDGFKGVLDDGGGFQVLHRLDILIRVIGGDYSELDEIRRQCNGTLRHVCRDDPARMETTLGYLWGLHAFLDGREIGWVRGRAPLVAGAAGYALGALIASEAPGPLKRWLAASFLATTKFWYVRALCFAEDDEVPPYLRNLPPMDEE